jgi:multidrug efflux pump
MKISDYALKNRAAVFVLVLISVIFGWKSYSTLPRESSPDVTVPYVFITTYYFGTSSSDMETLVTQEIEKKLSEIDNVKEMRSQSSEGVSSISVEFEADEDIDNMLAKVREKVDLAKPDLPSDAEDPYITEMNFGAFPIILVNITGDYDQVRLKNVAEDVRDEVENIKGILDVTLSGGLERELQVNVDPEKLRHYRLSLQDVQMAILNENMNMPGGNIDVGKYSYLLRVPGEILEPREIENFVVKSENSFPIYVRDVATVDYAFKERSSTARMEGQNCITLAVSKRSGENIIRIADEVRERCNHLLAELPTTTRIAFTSDQSKDIRMMVGELENGIINGLLLVVFVLIFFLGFRTSMFVAVAIPLSMLISFVVLSLLGYTLNMVVLFSLILALGMLVDNAIVVVENIYRFMEEGTRSSEAASKGVREVAWAVTASTATTLCAFVPLAFWPGIMGEFMSYLPITLIITLSSSLVVGLLINPAICASLLRVPKRKQSTNRLHDSKALQTYNRLLTWSLDHRLAVLIYSFLFLFGVLGLYAVFGNGVEFFPKIDPKKVFVDFELPSGSRLKTTDQMVQEIEKTLFSDEEIQTFVGQAGVGTGDFDAFSPTGGPAHKGRISIDMVDREFRTRSSRETMRDIRVNIQEMAGARVVVKEQEEGPPTGAPITIELSGDDFLVLGEISKEVLERLQKVRGIVNLKSDFDEGKPEIQVIVDRERAAYLGVGTAMIGSSLRAAFKGVETGSFRDGNDDIDITVRFAKDYRTRIEDIEDLQLVLDQGETAGDMIPLSSVASVVMTTGLSSITRKDQRRMVAITGDVEGRLASDALVEVRSILAEYQLPHGVQIEFGGENQEQEEAQEFLSRAFVMAIFAIGMVLVLQFHSLTTPIVIIFSVILSLSGVFCGLLITQIPFGIVMTGVGVISLAGIVVNNAIVLLDYTIQLRDRGLKKRDAIVQAGLTRARPVLLTATTTVLGLLPMATGVSFNFFEWRWITESDSSQWWSSMAIAVIFGLVFATVLTLVVVPVMYSSIDSLNQWLRRTTGKLLNTD